MGDEPDHKNLSPPRLESTNSILKQSIRFLLHLIAVYLIATIAVPRLSGWIYGTVLPIAEIHTTSLSRIEFMFSHLAALSLIAGFLAGLVNARFRHRVAQYVWTIPTGILLYDLATFTPQVLTQDRLAAAVHYYFGGGFLVPEYHSWKEFWSMMRGNPDMARGFEQAQVTGPLYSAVAYSLAAWICLHTSLDKKFVRKFEEWEYARIHARSADRADPDAELVSPDPHSKPPAATLPE